MNWLSDFKQWILDRIHELWTAISGFYHDISLKFLKTALSVISELINAIPVPDWMAQYSLGHLFSYLSPSLGYFVDRLGLSLGISLLGLGYAFRVTRKIVTALQW